MGFLDVVATGISIAAFRAGADSMQTNILTCGRNSPMARTDKLPITSIL